MLLGELPEAEDPEQFLEKLKTIFKVESLRHSEPGKPVKKVALCGGSGAFLMETAKAKGADCFITGEIHYHDYFESDGMLLVELGHYQSEQYTQDLLKDLLKKDFPEVNIIITSLNTNPIKYR